LALVRAPSRGVFALARRVQGHPAQEVPCMQHEHSVVTALAELTRMEEERIEGERRQLAERRVRECERELERRAEERVTRELSELRLQLAAEHEAQSAPLRSRIAELQIRLAAAQTGRDELREALATRAAEPAMPRDRPRAGIGVLVLTALSGSLAGVALMQSYTVARLEVRLRAHEDTAQAASPMRPILNPTQDATLAAPSVSRSEPASLPTAELASDSEPSPASGPRSPRTGRGVKRATTSRVRGGAAGDPLGTLEDCPDSDPTCGL
jgi:hypothetical protein